MRMSRNCIYTILSLALAVSLIAWGGCGAKKATSNGQDSSAADHGEGKPQVILFTQPG
jgi:hypothetical protein